MNTKSNISSQQAFSLLLISRLLSTITFMPILNNNAKISDYIVSMALGSISVFIFSIPIIVFIKRGRGINDITYRISERVNKFIMFAYALFFLIFVFSTLVRMNLFVSAVVFPQKSTAVFMVLSIAAACYAATHGLEALGRAGTISLFLLIISFLLILFSLRERVDINNLSPVFYDGATPVLKIIWSIVIRTFEPAIMLFILPRISRNALKSYLIWILSFSVIATIIIFFLMTSLGDAALLQLFPVHSMAVLSQVSVFERMDALLIGMWILSAFIKISFLIFLISELLAQCFERINKNTITVLLGIIIASAVLIESLSVTFFKITTSMVFGSVIFLIFIVMIPAIFVFKGAKK